MRYRQCQHHFTDRDQQAKALINCNDVLSTSEQEEVIAYFARSLRGSGQLLKVIVCLQAMLALVYMLLLLSGSLLIDVSVDMAATASLVQLAQQHKQGSPESAIAALEPTAPSQAPLEALAALDAEQRAAQRKYVHEYMNRRTAAWVGVRSGGAMTRLSALVVLYSIALLLWAGYSCYVACRQLTVNVEDLTRTEPRDLHRRRHEEGNSASAPAAKPRGALRHLRRRVKADPAVALYAAAAFASLGSLFWVAALVHRQRATQRAYANLGLQPPSVLSLQKITNAALEYVLAVWQPLFHLGIGLLVRSMLDTRDNLVALSKLKYRLEKGSASTKPGGSPSTSRTAHPARANASGNASISGKRPQGPRAPVHAKGRTERGGAEAEAKESDRVTYTVIITNAENDFGKLHRACLPYYCGLRSDYEETLDVERLVHEGGPQSRRLIGAVRGCSYAVRCRTETRSAEISLYGPANADFAPMQLTKAPRRPSTPAADATPTAAPTASSSAKLAHKDTTAPAEAVPEATALANVGAVEQLALRLRRQHYFEEHLPVSVHLPGRKADEVLLRIDKGSAPSDADGTDVTGVKSEEANGVAEDADADRQGSAATPVTAPASREKRQRVDEEGRNADAPSLQRVKTEAPDGDEEGMEENGATAHERGKTTENDVDRKADNGGRRSRRLTKSKSATIITQFPRRQKDFVTAVAALSSRVPLPRVRGRLRDLPGFLSCWSLYERHLRVVFRDAESLFKAKQLLDQFELEPGLRVSLIFSDPLSRTNAEYVRAQENESVNE